MGLPRYVKQTDEFSCGVVAVINALKWAEKSCSVRADWERLCLAMGALPGLGAPVDGIEQLLRQEGEGFFEVTYKRRHPTVHQFYKWVSHPDRSAVVIYAHEPPLTHAIFVPHAIGRWFEIINDAHTDEKISLVRYDVFRDWHYWDDQYTGLPYIWYLKKVSL